MPQYQGHPKYSAEHTLHDNVLQGAQRYTRLEFTSMQFAGNQQRAISDDHNLQHMHYKGLVAKLWDPEVLKEEKKEEKQEKEEDE